MKVGLLTGQPIPMSYGGSSDLDLPAPPMPTSNLLMHHPHAGLGIVPPSVAAAAQQVLAQRAAAAAAASGGHTTESSRGHGRGHAAAASSASSSSGTAVQRAAAATAATAADADGGDAAPKRKPGRPPSKHRAAAMARTLRQWNERLTQATQGDDDEDGVEGDGAHAEGGDDEEDRHDGADARRYGAVETSHYQQYRRDLNTSNSTSSSLNDTGSSDDIASNGYGGIGSGSGAAAKQQHQQPGKALSSPRVSSATTSTLTGRSATASSSSDVDRHSLLAEHDGGGSGGWMTQGAGDHDNQFSSGRGPAQQLSSHRGPSAAQQQHRPRHHSHQSSSGSRASAGPAAAVGAVGQPSEPSARDLLFSPVRTVGDGLTAATPHDKALRGIGVDAARGSIIKLSSHVNGLRLHVTGINGSNNTSPENIASDTIGSNLNSPLTAAAAALAAQQYHAMMSHHHHHHHQMGDGSGGGMTSPNGLDDSTGSLGDIGTARKKRSKMIAAGGGSGMGSPGRPMGGGGAGHVSSSGASSLLQHGQMQQPSLQKSGSSGRSKSNRLTQMDGSKFVEDVFSKLQSSAAAQHQQHQQQQHHVMPANGLPFAHATALPPQHSSLPLKAADSGGIHVSHSATSTTSTAIALALSRSRSTGAGSTNPTPTASIPAASLLMTPPPASRSSSVINPAPASAEATAPSSAASATSAASNCARIGRSSTSDADATTLTEASSSSSAAASDSGDRSMTCLLDSAQAQQLQAQQLPVLSIVSPGVPLQRHRSTGPSAAGAESSSLPASALVGGKHAQHDALMEGGLPSTSTATLLPGGTAFLSWILLSQPSNTASQTAGAADRGSSATAAKESAGSLAAPFSRVPASRRSPSAASTQSSEAAGSGAVAAATPSKQQQQSASSAAPASLPRPVIGVPAVSSDMDTAHSSISAYLRPGVFDSARDSSEGDAAMENAGPASAGYGSQLHQQLHQSMATMAGGGGLGIGSGLQSAPNSAIRQFGGSSSSLQSMTMRSPAPFASGSSFGRRGFGVSGAAALANHISNAAAAAAAGRQLASSSSPDGGQGLGASLESLSSGRHQYRHRRGLPSRGHLDGESQDDEIIDIHHDNNDNDLDNDLSTGALSISFGNMSFDADALQVLGRTTLSGGAGTAGAGADLQVVGRSMKITHLPVDFAAPGAADYLSAGYVVSAAPAAATGAGDGRPPVKAGQAGGGGFGSGGVLQEMLLEEARDGED